MNKAVEIFIAVPRCHNCAQAVAAGCGYNDLVEELKDFGGGKAPENCCGALYAAMRIAGNRDGEIIRNDFVARLGSAACRELKSATPPVACVECVKTAAELLEKYGKC